MPKKPAQIPARLRATTSSEGTRVSAIAAANTIDPQTSVVETHMSRLRAKVDRDFDLALIRTLRGIGYCLRADA